MLIQRSRISLSRQSFLIDPQGILRKIYNPVNAFSHAEEVLSDLNTLTEVIDQLGLLKRRQREMQDSINAASRIQNALLPNLKSILPKNFGISLFYKPLEKKLLIEKTGMMTMSQLPTQKLARQPMTVLTQ